MMIRRISASIRAIVSLVAVPALLAIAVAACGETPVDQSTATVTNRSPRDSTIYHDSTLWRDSVIYRDSVITRTRDSVIVVIHDSVKITFRDSVVVVRRDTLIRRFDQSAVRNGIIYFHDLNGRAAQTPLLVDSATRLTIELSPKGPTGLRLDLMGHPADDLWSNDRKLAPLPVWLHLSLPDLPLIEGSGFGLPAGDPIFGPGFGVLQRSRLAPAPLWMHTGMAGNSAGFTVDAVDTVSRQIYVRFHVEFTTPEPLKIDSARIVMSY